MYYSTNYKRDESSREGTKGGKGGYELRLSAGQRDDINEWASWSERGREAERGEGDVEEGETPPLRLAWDEGKTTNL